MNNLFEFTYTKTHYSHHIPADHRRPPFRQTEFEKTTTVLLELDKIDLIRIEELRIERHSEPVYFMFLLYNRVEVKFENIRQEEINKLKATWMAWKTSGTQKSWRNDTADALFEDL